jgi:hypothetical protein
MGLRYPLPNGYLLTAVGDQRAAIRTRQEVGTDLVALKPGLSVWSYPV